MKTRTAKTIAAAATGLLLGLLGGYQWARVRHSRRRKPNGSRSATRAPKQDFERRYDRYAREDKKVLAFHTERALSKLTDRNNELQVAAAINSYVYQYLINKDNSGGAAKVLRDGHAICGGSVATMAEMLYALKIRSKYVYLLGIPGHSGHSLLEVFFKDGSRGLFDPTYGTLWHDQASARPISISKLLENPELCKTSLYKSRGARRKVPGDPVLAIAGLAAGYERKVNYREPGYDPCKYFLIRDQAGTANDGQKQFVTLSLTPGEVLGKPKLTTGDKSPWRALMALRDKSGRYVPWAHWLGRKGSGYDISHVYRLKGLKPGSSYALKLSYVKATRHTLLCARRLDHREPALYRTLQELRIRPGSLESRVVEIPVSANAESAMLLVTANRSLVLHAIELAAANRKSN